MTWQDYQDTFPTEAALAAQNLDDYPHSKAHGDLGDALNLLITDLVAGLDSMTPVPASIEDAVAVWTQTATGVTCAAPTGTAATDEANFIAACNAAMASPTTKRVYLREGTYVFDSVQVLTSPTYDRLEIVGPRTAKIKSSSTSVNPLRVEADYVRLSGFTMDGADVITAGTGDRNGTANLLVLQQCEGVEIRDMWFQYAGNSAIVGNSATRCVVEGNTIWQSGGSGISFNANLASCEDNVIRNNRIWRTERTGDDGYLGGGMKLMGHQVGQSSQATYGKITSSSGALVTTYTDSGRTTTGNHGLSNGDPVWFAVDTTTDLGVTNGRRYYVSGKTNTTFKLAPTYTDAIAGTNLVSYAATGNVNIGWYTQRRLTVDGNKVIQPYIYGGMTLTSVSATSGSSTFTKNSHGLPSGRTECRVHTFSGFTGLTDTTTVYWVESTGTNTFEIYTASSGGSAQAATATGTFSLTTVPAEGLSGNESIVVQEPTAIGGTIESNTVLGGTIGISLSTAQGFTVGGNNVNGFSKYGIELAGAQDCTVAGNTIDGQQMAMSDSLGASAVPGSVHLGIVVWPESSKRDAIGNVVDGNTIRGLRPTTQTSLNSKGILVQSPVGKDMQTIVVNNRIKIAGYVADGDPVTIGNQPGGAFGIHLNRCWGTTVSNNQIDGGELGSTAFEGLRIQASGTDALVGVFIRGNYFRNLTTGIRFNTSGTPDMSDSEIRGNFFASTITTVLTDDPGWTYTARAPFVGNFGSATAFTDETPTMTNS